MASNHKYLDVSALCPQYFSLPQTTVNIHIDILSVNIYAGLLIIYVMLATNICVS